MYRLTEKISALLCEEKIKEQLKTCEQQWANPQSSNLSTALYFYTVAV
jgi:hypothetical protein